MARPRARRTRVRVAGSRTAWPGRRPPYRRGSTKLGKRHGLRSRLLPVRQRGKTCLLPPAFVLCRPRPEQGATGCVRPQDEQLSDSQEGRQVESKAPTSASHTHLNSIESGIIGLQHVMDAAAVHADHQRCAARPGRQSPTHRGLAGVETPQRPCDGVEVRAQRHQSGLPACRRQVVGRTDLRLRRPGQGEEPGEQPCKPGQTARGPDAVGILRAICPDRDPVQRFMWPRLGEAGPPGSTPAGARRRAPPAAAASPARHDAPAHA